MVRTTLLLLILFVVTPSFAQDSEQSRFAEALRFLQQGRLEQASIGFKKLVIANPQKNIYWFNLGTVEAMRGNHEYAIKVFGRVITTNSPLAPAAKLYSAKSLRALGRIEDALALLNDLNQQQLPSNMRAEVAKDLAEINEEDPENAALEAYRKGELDKAEEFLSKLGLETLSADGAMLYGLVLYKKGNMSRASEVFQSVLRNPTINPERKNLTAELLKKIKRGAGDALPYWVAFDGSAGYTSNAFSDGRSTSGVSSPLLRTTLSGGYHFQKGQRFSFKTGYLMNYEEPIAAAELRTLSHTVQVPMIWEKSSTVGSLIPYMQWQNWAGVLVSEKTGAGFKFSTAQQSFDVGADADLSTMRSMSTSYTYLQGNSYSVKPYLGIFSQSLYFQVFYSYGTDGTQDIVYSDASLLPLQHNFQGPGMKVIYRAAENSAVFFNMAQMQKNFNSVSLPALKTRNDRELSVSLKYTQWLYPKLSIYGLGEWTSNSSTLGAGDVRDKNYEILILMAGFNWDVF